MYFFVLQNLNHLFLLCSQYMFPKLDIISHVNVRTGTELQELLELQFKNIKTVKWSHINWNWRRRMETEFSHFHYPSWSLEKERREKVETFLTGIDIIGKYHKMN